MSKYFFIALAFLSIGAQAEMVEGCMVVEELGSSYNPDTSTWGQVNSNSYDLADDVSTQLNVPLELIQNLEITLAAGPGMQGSASHETYAVIAKISDLVSGTTTNSWGLVINDTGADEIGKNMHSIEYSRPNHDVIQINCARVER